MGRIEEVAAPLLHDGAALRDQAFKLVAQRLVIEEKELLGRLLHGERQVGGEMLARVAPGIERRLRGQHLFGHMHVLWCDAA